MSGSGRARGLRNANAQTDDPQRAGDSLGHRSSLRQSRRDHDPARSGQSCIAFLRTGTTHGNDRLIKAHHALVSATELCTVLGDVETGAVATVEHLMSALFGLGVDNALIEIDGPEMPILDGSALPFVQAIDQVGIATCDTPRRWLKILRHVRIETGTSFAELRPIDRGFRLDVEIDFESPVIGRSRKAMDLSPATYRREIAGARTFDDAGRGALLEGGLRPRRLAGEHRGGRRDRGGQPRGAALPGRIRPPQDPRRDRRPGAGRVAIQAPTAPIAAATG